MDKYEIVTLAEDYNVKKRRRDCLAAQNASGLEPDEELKLSVEYHVADAECIQAYLRLESAKVYTR